MTTHDDLFGTLPAAQRTAERIPGARLIVLEDGWHLFLGRPQEVDGAIAHFVEALEAPVAQRRQLHETGTSERPSLLTL